MPDASHLLKRLREQPEHIEALVELVLNDLLERPLSELIQPTPMGNALVAGLRASVGDPRTKDWIRNRLSSLQERLAQDRASLLGRVPSETVRPIQDLLRRPYSPDAMVMRALVDHSAMRNLMREVLTHSLTDFASSIKLPGPKSLGKGRLAQWAGAATVAAKMVGSEVERQLEGRVKVYVDGALSHAIKIAVEHVCNPANAKEYGSMRADMVDVVLAFPVNTWSKELEKLEPDALIEDIHQILQSAMASPELERELRGALETLITEQGHLSARSFLDGSGLEESWRPPLQELLLTQTQQVVAGPEFERWLTALCES